MIEYTEEKRFSKEQVEKLFLSLGWVSGQYPERLHKALMNSSTVISAWDGDRLVGLVRAIDDTELVCYLHYVLVDPAYHGFGIGTELMNRLVEKYRNYLYIEVMPEESKNETFYRRFGFQKMEDGVALQRCNFSDRR